MECSDGRQKIRLKVVTLGCKSNRYDGDILKYRFHRMGCSVLPDKENDADIIIVNACSVTENALNDSLYVIRRQRRLSPRATMVLTGCISEDEISRLRAAGEIDYVFAHFDHDKVVSLLKRDVGLVESTEEVEIPHTFGERTRAFLKVQDGCNSRCAFCLIPSLRGHSRSFDPDLVLKRADEIARAGYKEIVLTGIHIGDYRFVSCGETLVLSDLIRRILNVLPQRFRVRISSIEPLEVTDQLIDLMVADGRLCRHLHIPLQSGSDRILGLMKRPYRTGQYAALCDKLTSKIEGISIGADVIAGFPTEAEKDFGETVGFIERLPLMYLHVFPYSRRKGTAAEILKPEVEKAEIGRRAAVLRELGKEKRREFLRREHAKGDKTEILVERWDGKVGEGFTDNYIRVLCSSEARPFAVNQFATVGIQKVQDEVFVSEVKGC